MRARSSLLAILAAVGLGAGASLATSGADTLPREIVLEGWVQDIEPTVLIHGETPPPGTVLTRHHLRPDGRLGLVAYLRTADPAIDFTAERGRWCLLRGELRAGEIVYGGRILPGRAADVLVVTELRAFDGPHRLRRDMRSRILRDLFRRGVDYGRDGTSEPSGTLPRGAREIALDTPPAGSADMYTETAYLDRSTRTYWAVRTGGFAGVVQWVGPFRLGR